MPQDKKNLITKQGFEDLKKEYETLKNVKFPQVIERVSTAREAGDLSENSEYQTAKEEQEFLETRIEEIEEILKNVKVVEDDSSKKDSVKVGSNVTVKADGEEMIFAIVGTTEADPLKGKISEGSPVGAALLGAKVGDTIVVQNQGIKTEYRILKIS